jgi:superfamily II DNA or RNA helicase
MSRALIFVRQRRVEILEQAARAVIAEVDGAELAAHLVNVAVLGHRPNVLRCGCACVVATRGEPCEHVYATLLVLDERTVDLGADGHVLVIKMEEPWLDAPPRRRREPDDELDELDDADADDDDADDDTAPPAGADDDEAPEPAPTSTGPSAALRRPASAATWTQRLAWFEPTAPSRASPDAKIALEYHLEVRAAIGRDGAPEVLPDEVEVITYSRRLKRDGRLGARGRFVREQGRSPALRADDWDALDALAMGTPIAAPYGYGRSDWSSTTRGARLHTGIVDRVLPALAATGRLGWLDDDRADRAIAAATVALRPLRWDGAAPFRIAVEVGAAGAKVEVGAWLVRGDERLALSAVTAMFGGGCAAIGERLIRVDDGAQLARWWAATSDRPMTVPRGQLARCLQAVAKLAPILVIDPSIGWAIADEQPSAHLELDEAGPGAFSATAVFRYGTQRRAADDPGGFLVDPVGLRLIRVDLAAEAAGWAALQAALGPHLEPLAIPLERGPIAIPADRLGALVPALEAAGWEVWLRRSRLRSGGHLAATVASGIDWFDVALTGEIGGAAIDAAALIAAIRAGRQLVRLADGSHGVVPADWLAQHRGLAQLGTIHDGAVRVPRARAMILDVMLAAVPEIETDARFRRLHARLSAWHQVEPAAEPRGFVGELRHYQRDGLGWLGFLREVGFGGCLADDMGLGKTVQVLAAIAAIRRGRKHPSLVVAPKSVVFNWLDEARRFLPGVEVVDYTGLDRAARRAELPTAELIITTYATMRLDIEALAAQPFAYVVLDEAQAIKNPTSQVARAARLLQGEHRLALTGTPVENHLGDLASILEFLNPGMIGDVAALGRLADRAVEAPDEVAPLARALRPFLLRRTKAQVLPELPARTEQVLKCQLVGAQRRFYDHLREGYRTSLLQRVATDGMARSTMHVLEALLRLRQAACAPVLVAADRAADGSAKLDLLMEQLAEVIEAGHKALVFSQFTSFLALVRVRLDAAGIVHEYLDGQTHDRKARVARFQEDPACPVFAISLRAGGTGLNLTAASYVFLLDPWWNPAVEAQAIDRSHRLGQTRAVTAYRVIAEDTVEDKILALQHQKRALLDGLFAEDAGQLASLTAADLAILLAP